MSQNVKIPDSLPEVSPEGQQKVENTGRSTPKTRLGVATVHNKLK